MLKSKSIKIFVTFCLMVSMLALPVSAQNDEVHFNIQLTGSNYDEASNETVLTYQVTGDGTPALSNWILSLCSDTEVVDASHNFELKTDPDPNTGLTGIKFEEQGVDETVDFNITVIGEVELGMIDAAIKGATDIQLLEVEGPICVNQSDEDTDADVDAGSDTNVEADVDTDSDINAEADVDADSDTNVEADVGTDVDVDKQITLVAEVSDSNELIIEAVIAGEDNIDGSWEFNLGGRNILVKGGSNINHTVKNPPVGTYEIKATFVADDGSASAEIKGVSVTVPTEQGGTLPNTATNQYNLLLMGALILLAGGIMLWFGHRRRV